MYLQRVPGIKGYVLAKVFLRPGFKALCGDVNLRHLNQWALVFVPGDQNILRGVCLGVFLQLYIEIETTAAAFKLLGEVVA